MGVFCLCVCLFLVTQMTFVDDSIISSYRKFRHLCNMCKLSDMAIPYVHPGKLMDEM